MNLISPTGKKSCACSCGAGTYQRTFEWTDDEDGPEPRSDGWFSSQIRGPSYRIDLRINCEKCKVEFRLRDNMDWTISEIPLSEDARVEAAFQCKRADIEANRQARDAVEAEHRVRRWHILDLVLGAFLDNVQQEARAANPKVAVGTAVFRYLKSKALPTGHYATEGKFRNAFRDSLRNFVLNSISVRSGVGLRNAWLNAVPQRSTVRAAIHLARSPPPRQPSPR